MPVRQQLGARDATANSFQPRPSRASSIMQMRLTEPGSYYSSAPDSSGLTPARPTLGQQDALRGIPPLPPSAYASASVYGDCSQTRLSWRASSVDGTTNPLPGYVQIMATQPHDSVAVSADLSLSTITLHEQKILGRQILDNFGYTPYNRNQINKIIQFRSNYAANIASRKSQQMLAAFAYENSMAAESAHHTSTILPGSQMSIRLDEGASFTRSSLYPYYGVKPRSPEIGIQALVGVADSTDDSVSPIRARSAAAGLLACDNKFRVNTSDFPPPPSPDLIRASAGAGLGARDSEFRGSAGEQHFRDDAYSDASNDGEHSEAHSDGTDGGASCGGIDSIVMRAACDEASAAGFAAVDAMHSIAIQKMQKEARKHEHANAQLLAALDDYRQAAQQQEEERTHQKLLVHDLAHKQNVQEPACLPVPATADPFALLKKALRQFGSGNAVKITEINNVSATVSVEFVLLTWSAEFNAAGMGEPDMLQIFRKMMAGGNLHEWALSYQLMTEQQMHDSDFMPNWTWMKFTSMLTKSSLYHSPDYAVIIVSFKDLKCADASANVHAAITKYTSSFEQRLHTVKAHGLNDYVTTSGPTLAQQLYGGLPPICKQLMARRNPVLEFPDLRSNYDELKREIICVLNWPDAKSEFAKFEHDSMSQRKIHAGVKIDPSQQGRDLGGKEKQKSAKVGCPNDYYMMAYTSKPGDTGKWLSQVQSSAGSQKMEFRKLPDDCNTQNISLCRHTPR